MKQKKHSALDAIFFFIFFGILSYGIYSFSCTTYPKFNFDSQIPLTQAFAASKGFLPYRDIYFPYGIFFYLKDYNLLLGIIYVFLLPILFVSFLLLFKKLWSNSIYAYISFFFLAYFIVKFPGIETFRRYGVIATLGLLFSYIFSKQVYVNHFTSLLTGLLAGIVFSLMNDQGIYAFFLYCLLLFTNPLIRKGVVELKKRKYYAHLFFGVVSFVAGCLFGFFPFLIYLTSHKIFYSFLTYLVHLGDFALYAKTPFIPFSSTSDNLFTFSMLFLSIFFIAYNILYKKKFSLSFYIIFNYILILILLEQKSLIRSLDKVITFIAVTLFITLAYECVIFLKEHKIANAKILLCYILLIVIVLFKLNLHPFTFSTYQIHAISSSNNVCLSMNLSNFLSQNKKYKYVERQIKEDPRFSGKVFSYLSDPIFYVLFNQKPPYYFTIFEASPLYAQKENIKYIEENDVSHIIYNMDILPLQDNVPDYARGSLLFKYIINNFTIKENIQNFLILKKADNNNDFFENKILKKLHAYQDYLLHVKLGAIPKSEGIYKGKDVYRNKNNIIISSNSSSVINNFLHNNNIKTSGKVLVFKAIKYKKNNREIRIVLKTNDGKITTVGFYRCDINKPCVVSLSNIPLFYKERVLKEIVLDNSFEGQIDLLNNTTESIF